MISLLIDGIEIQAQEGENVLTAARNHGIHIPHLCHHSELTDTGTCGLCVVEVEGQEHVQRACTLSVKEGMKILTQTEKLIRMRRTAMELLLAAHPEHCTGCEKYGQCEFQLLIREMDAVSGILHKRTKRRGKKQKNQEQTFWTYNIEKCILCGRCVRACKEISSLDMLAYMKENQETYIGQKKEHSFTDEEYLICGRICAKVCPTGAFLMNDGGNAL